ncbi:flavin reductase [Sporanaerobium hydrogeniformans]|uniref:Flavin reductase n=1 Tax=Sporanaerobium hydrogeniformans TaxID=3072179 RepID=A0AC61DEP0_9FIRM|nr:flavin reductase family protein [Sporanaerobium hydrogeniformans]PHV71027.1 flavin reductase [Sporanaerobium hydrogeniformans]
MKKQKWKAGNMIYPLPAVMVSCGTVEKPNIITIAWTGTICTNPAMTYVSIRPSRFSYELIKETGYFVINLTTKELLRATDYCGVRSGRDHDKFSEMQLTPDYENESGCPMILESPVSIECKVKQIMPLGSHDMFIAEVMNVYVDENYMDEKGKFQLNQTGLIAYSHGTYLELGQELGTFGYSVKKGKKIQKKNKESERLNNQKTGEKSRKRNKKSKKR